MSEENNEINEPAAQFEKKVKRSITFFKSFEEAEHHSLEVMAKHTPAERLANLEVLRKRTYAHLLLANGNWPPLERKIVIVKGIEK